MQIVGVTRSREVGCRVVWGRARARAGAGARARARAGVRARAGARGRKQEHEQEHEDGSRSTRTEAGLHFLSVCCGGVCGVWGGPRPRPGFPVSRGRGGGICGQWDWRGTGVRSCSGRGVVRSCCRLMARGIWSAAAAGLVAAFPAGRRVTAARGVARASGTARFSGGSGRSAGRPAFAGFFRSRFSFAGWFSAV